MNIKFGKNKKGFTLAETLTVLSIIGAVAAITIPSLYINSKNTENISKIKKAVSTYDSLIRRVAVENRLATNERLSSYLTRLDCQNLRNYMRLTIADGCTIKTTDGLWWQFGSIDYKPYAVVGLKKDYVEQFDGNNIPDVADTAPIFVFAATYDNGRLHINDETALGENNNNHLYDFLEKRNNKKINWKLSKTDLKK